MFEGKGRARAGDILAEVMEAEGERAKQVEEERGRFLRAPVVIGVISAAREQHKIPVWEQELSAGAVCQNILIAAHALGFVGNWLTEWYAYHPVVKERLGLKAGRARRRVHLYRHLQGWSWKNGPGRRWTRSSRTSRPAEPGSCRR